ncbi:MAG: hypothetical protein J1E81_06260 [Eubacterium sp.]|nr:hypothetical protein [Eubacterium sp.]
MTPAQRFQDYLRIIANPDKMQVITKIEFLNPDDTVAYALDGTYKRRYGGYADSRAFLQDGNINISLNNGQRRTASVRFENLDNAFDYAVNKLWFGQRVRLLKGVILSDGSEFYLPQGVFYFNSPKTAWKPNARTTDYQLVDKWAYLDGTLFGNLENTYEVPSRTNIFEAIQGILNLSKFTHTATSNIEAMIDCVKPLFTDYYNNRYNTINGEEVPMNLAPYTVTTALGSTYGKVFLDLNSILAGWIGYNANGALEVEPSQDDINDADKPVMWSFSENSKTFLGLDETANPSQVYNDVIVWGENLDGGVVGARATNHDPTSDTNANLIGLKTYVESSDINYSNEQCQALANWYLKRKTVLQKSVTFSCTQMFHLRENNLVSVLRSDKPNSPIEKHLIQSMTIPLKVSGAMSITATSIQDFPDVTEVSMDEFLNAQGGNQ